MPEDHRPLRATLFVDSAGKHRFRIIAPNGEPIAASEAYSRKIDALTTALLAVAEENVEEE